MQLIYSKEIKNKVITISLETANFTPEELTYIDDLGEPVVSFDKVYNNFLVKIDRRIKTGFKLIQKFDGSANLTEAANAANSFMEDIQLELEKIMTELRESHLALMFEESKGFIDIVY